MASLGNLFGGPSNTNKIVWMVGLGAVVAATVTWILPKIEKNKVVVVPHPSAAVPVSHHPVTPATSPAAHHQAVGPVRDYNLSGLAIEDDTHLAFRAMEELADYPTSSGVALSGI